MIAIHTLHTIPNGPLAPIPDSTIIPSSNTPPYHAKNCPQQFLYSYTQSSDASLGFSFTGEAVAIYGTVAPNMGNDSVYLDGIEHVYNAGSDGSSQVLHEKVSLF